MTLGGLWLIYLTIQGLRQSSKNLRQAAVAGAWPTTTGRIVKSSIVEGRHTDSSTNQEIHTYRPEVEYAYQVGGKDYTSTRFAFGKVLYYQRTEADAFLQKYATGSPAAVRHDPGTPADAVLDISPEYATGTRKGDYLMMGFGVIILGIGLWGVFTS